MAVRFALRSRIVLREEPERTRAIRMPPFALPVASYWAIMGLLTYGIASGALRPERFTALHPFPKGTFESGRVAPERPPESAPLQAPRAPATPDDDAAPATDPSDTPIAATRTAAPPSSVTA